jgi:hypothetical protein
MVDVGLSHALEDCPQTQAQKKCLYLETHASNDLSTALSVEIKDEVKMEYGWPESKCMAQAIVRNHHQVSQRISHHHLHFLIRVKKGNQVLKKKKQDLPVWKNWTVRFPKLNYPVLAE